ncbi:hypothetical protein NMY22_g16169 [Coprinellus aureogranulatus]|nr:hypothetical protein NMY22_g16169 [Coprinellus aureogranulatus]
MWEDSAVGIGMRRRLRIAGRNVGQKVRLRALVKENQAADDQPSTNSQIQTQSEDWARKVIDCFTDVLADGEDNERVVCQLEMDLARATRVKTRRTFINALRQGDSSISLHDPVERGDIVKGTDSMPVTGSVDYMIMSLPPKVRAKFWTDESNHSPSLTAEAVKKAETLDRATALLDLERNHGINLLPIEAKRVEERNLEAKHHPQILTQVHLRCDTVPIFSLWERLNSIMRQQHTACGKTERGRHVLGSSATEDTWVFGISHVERYDTDDEEDLEHWSCVHFEEDLFGDDEYVPCGGSETESEREAHRQREAQWLDRIMTRAKAIMRILTIWVSADTRCFHSLTLGSDHAQSRAAQCYAPPGQLWRSFAKPDSGSPQSRAATTVTIHPPTAPVLDAPGLKGSHTHPDDDKTAPLGPLASLQQPCSR